MNWGTGFFSDELKIHYANNNESADTSGSTYYGETESYYFIKWLIDGSFKVIINDFSTIVKTPALIISKPFFRPQIIEKSQVFQTMHIAFHPKTFDSIKDDADFFRAFYQKESEQLYYDLNLAQNSTLEPLLFSLKSCLLAHYGHSHMLPRLQSVISELCMLYDAHHKDMLESTDSISVKVMDYIDRNYTRKITLDEISEKFFISKPTINAVVKCNRGKSFHEYLNFIRLREARKMLHANHSNAASIGELTGFPVYSTFYRAYKREYGITPTQDIIRKRQYWQLSKKKINS